MKWNRGGFLFLAAIAAVLMLTACGGGAAQQDEQQAAEWTWLTETKQELDGKRRELADLDLQARAAAAAEEEEAEAEVEEGEGEAEEQEVVDFAGQIATLEEEIETLDEEFSGRLVAFLNADPMIEGEPPTERQIAALRMKSDEDILLAQEWIVKGGDYKRAIEIYNTALMFDPDNEKVKAALAEAETNRYMNEDRFGQVKKGMTEDEVRELLGQVNLHNMREYPDKDVEAWFYPTSEGGSAAAVWFQPDKKSGIAEVYQVKFDAIDPSKAEEE